MKTETKTQAVKNILATNSSLSNREISELVGCHITYVHQLRRKTMTKAKITQTKVKAKAKNKGGRPNIFQTLEKSCETLLKYVGNRTNMCIAFDNKKDKVEIMYGDEVYNVATHEVIDFLLALKKIESHKQTFN